MLRQILLFCGKPGARALGVLNGIGGMKGFVARDEFDFLTAEDPSNNVFGELNGVVKSTGASAYQLITTIGIIGFVVSIMFLGLSLGLNKNSQKRSEAKDWLIWLAIGMLIFFGAMFLIGLFAGIGRGLGT